MAYYEENKTNFPHPAKSSTCWISLDHFHFPFDFHAATFAFFHRTSSINKQKYLRTFSSQKWLFSPTCKNWMFRHWLEILHLAAINQDFLLVKLSSFSQYPWEHRDAMRWEILTCEWPRAHYHTWVILLSL